MPSFIPSCRLAFLVLSFLLYAGQLAAQPAITSFTPTSAAPGTSVTINGIGFNTTMASNVVYIGKVRGTVTAASGTSLTVTVPTGAMYAPVSVLNTGTGLLDESRQFFMPESTALGRAVRATDYVSSLINADSISGTIFAATPADFNNDGKLDLVTSSNSVDNKLYIRLNTSSADTISFGAATSYTITGFTQIADNAVGDIDGDGQLDIVAISGNTNQFAVLQNTGSMTFAQTFLATGSNPAGVKLADFDRDGKLDVVVIHASTDGARVFRNTTVGGTISFAASVDFTIASTSAWNLTIDDFNADGKDDIAFVSNSATSVRFMENTSSGAGNINFSTLDIDTGNNTFPTFVISGQLDDDGKPDAIVNFAESSETRAGLLTNSSGANIAFNALGFITGLGSHQDTSSLGDLDGDGDVDLLIGLSTGSGTTYNYAVRTNTSTTGNIAFTSQFTLSSAGNGIPRNSLIADLDGDNKQDLLVINANSGNYSVFRGNALTAPVTQATNVTFTPTTPTQASLSWTSGSGQRRIVFMKQTGSTSDNPAPVDLTDYSVSSTFGAGDQIGATGWYAVATGTGTSATVTGLTQNTVYRVMVVEYNNNGFSDAAIYQTSTATGNPLNFTTPVPVAITSLTRAAASPTNAATRTYTLTLGGNVTAGMASGRFSLTVTGSIAGASVASVTGSGASYTVTVNTGTGSGDLTLNLANATGIVPGISTTLPFAGETYVIDKTTPILAPVTITSNNNTDTAAAVPGDTVTISFTASEAIATPTVLIAGHAATVTNVGGNNWTATIVMTDSDTSGTVPFQITFGDPVGNAGTATATTNASSISFAVPSGPTSVSGLVDNVDLTGPLEILSGAVVNGGRLTGQIFNNGTITGTITLGPDTTIDGGTVSGIVRGDPAFPAVFMNVTIPVNTRLEHVIIGPNTTLSPNAVIGAGVRFDSRSLIPPGLDFTNALAPFRWSGSDDLMVVDLDRDVLRTSVRSILEALRLIPGLAGNDLEQNTNGELVMRAQTFGSMVLPVRVKQTTPGTAAGIYFNGDGNIILVTADGQEVLVYPVLQADTFFDTELKKRGLTFNYDAQGRLLMMPAQTGFYYVARATPTAVPAFRDDARGLHAHVLNNPKNVAGYSLIFTDENGTLLEQDLVPVPANWPLLRAALAALPGVGDVTLDTTGDITVELNGRRVRGRTSYQVVTGSSAGLPTTGASLQRSGDLNGDGVGDYRIFYPGGEVQTLFVYP